MYLLKSILILLMVVCPGRYTTFCVSMEIPLPAKPKDLKGWCLEISERLNDLGYLSVCPEKFAEFIWIVSYCESGHKLKVRGDSGSIGLWQMTQDTRNRLGVKHGGLETQVENYFKFLVAGERRLKYIKSSVDLHCYNFSPSRFTQDTLSKVTNDRLKALDLNKDSIITKEDIRLFQRLRLKV